MAESKPSPFTFICLWLGFFGYVGLGFLFRDHIEAIIFPLSDSTPSRNFSPISAPMGVYWLYSLPIAAGLLVCWIASRIDFVDKPDENDAVGWVIKGYVGLYVLGSIARLMAIGFANGGEGSILSDLLLMIPKVFAILGTGLFTLVIYPFGGTFVVAGVLCLPRAIIALTRRSALRSHWEDVQSGRDIDGPKLSGVIGRQTSSDAGSRAEVKDLRIIEHEADQLLAVLQRERDQLKAGVLRDIERGRTEARVAGKMESIEDVRIEIDVLKRFQRDARA